MGEAEERQHDHTVAMAHLRQLELQLAALSRELGDTRVHNEHEIRDLKEELASFCAWMQDDSKKSAWFYEAEADLRQMVESTRWVRTTKRIVVWLVGAAVGTIMAWNAAAVWIKENL
jgi:phosphate uptake regulator